MQKRLVLILLYLAIAFVTMLNEQLMLFISATVLFIGLLLADFWRISKRQLAGDFILRKHTKRLQPGFIILALFAILVFFLSESSRIYQLFIIWMMVLVDLGTVLITKKLKPIAMRIQGSELILNDYSTTRKNLAELNEVALNGWRDELKLTFANQGPLTIKREEYDALELQNFIDQCIACSTREVTISDNLKQSVQKEQNA